MEEEKSFIVYKSNNSPESGEIWFNYPLTDADITRLNNSKIIKVVHEQQFQKLTIVKYRELPFFDLFKLKLVLDEFITFKSRTN